jgi:hypothetical protein
MCWEEQQHAAHHTAAAPSRPHLPLPNPLLLLQGLIYLLLPLLLLLLVLVEVRQNWALPCMLLSTLVPQHTLALPYMLLSTLVPQPQLKPADINKV